MNIPSDNDGPTTVQYDTTDETSPTRDSTTSDITQTPTINNTTIEGGIDPTKCTVEGGSEGYKLDTVLGETLDELPDVDNNVELTSAYGPSINKRAGGFMAQVTRKVNRVVTQLREEQGILGNRELAELQASVYATVERQTVSLQQLITEARTTRQGSLLTSLYDKIQAIREHIVTITARFMQVREEHKAQLIGESASQVGEDEKAANLYCWANDYSTFIMQYLHEQGVVVPGMPLPTTVNVSVQPAGLEQSYLSGRSDFIRKIAAKSRDFLKSTQSAQLVSRRRDYERRSIIDQSEYERRQICFQRQAGESRKELADLNRELEKWQSKREERKLEAEEIMEAAQIERERLEEVDRLERERINREAFEKQTRIATEAKHRREQKLADEKRMAIEQRRCELLDQHEKRRKEYESGQRSANLAREQQQLEEKRAKQIDQRNIARWNAMIDQVERVASSVERHEAQRNPSETARNWHLVESFRRHIPYYDDIKPRGSSLHESIVPIDQHPNKIKSMQQISQVASKMEGQEARHPETMEELHIKGCRCIKCPHPSPYLEWIQSKVQPNLEWRETSRLERKLTPQNCGLVRDNSHVNPEISIDQFAERVKEITTPMLVAIENIRSDVNLVSERVSKSEEHITYPMKEYDKEQVKQSSLSCPLNVTRPRSGVYTQDPSPLINLPIRKREQGEANQLNTLHSLNPLHPSVASRTINSRAHFRLSDCLTDSEVDSSYPLKNPTRNNGSKPCFMAEGEHLQKSGPIPRPHPTKGVETVHTDIVAEIARAAARQSLPPQKPPCFAGEAKHWRTFIEYINAQVVAKDFSNTEKFHYLLQLLQKEPRSLAETFTGNPEAFALAYKRLVAVYGGNTKVASSIVDELSQGGLVTTSIELVKLSDRIENALSVLPTVGCTSYLERPDILRNIVRRLTLRYRQKWRRLENQVESHGQVLTLQHLHELISTEAVAELKSNYSEEQLQSEHRTITKPLRSFSTEGHPKVLNTLATKIPSPIGPVIKERQDLPPDFRGCQFCAFEGRCYSDHKLGTCSAFSRLDIDKRRLAIRTLDACWKCLAPGHRRLNCSDTLIDGCAECGRLHHRLLHTNQHTPTKRFSQQHSTMATKAIARRDKTVTFNSTAMADFGDQHGSSGDEEYGNSTVSNETSISAAPHVTLLTREQSAAFSVVPIRINGELGSKAIYCLLDPASTDTYIDEEVAGTVTDVLKVPVTQMNIGSMHGNKPVTVRRLTLQLDSLLPRYKQSIQELAQLPLKAINISAIRDFAALLGPVPRPTEAEQEYFQRLGIPQCKVGYHNIAMLIGTDQFAVHQVWETRPNPIIPMAPYANRGVLGWYTRAPGVLIKTTDNHMLHSNLTVTMATSVNNPMTFITTHDSCDSNSSNGSLADLDQVGYESDVSDDQYSSSIDSSNESNNGEFNESLLTDDTHLSEVRTFATIYSGQTREGALAILRDPEAREDARQYAYDFIETDQALNIQTLRWLEQDSVEPGSYEPALSADERKSIDIMERTIRQLPNRHYEVGMLWRSSPPQLINNRPLALRRLRAIRERLLRDETIHVQYRTQIDNYLEQGYAVKMEHPEHTSGQTYYLPHHFVTHPDKPGRVRVVNDCAAKYRGMSLNSELMDGPNLNNNLIGILMRFRQRLFAFTCDVEAMYHQVHALAEDCDSLRFLWYPKKDLSGEPTTYQMKVRIFGARDSQDGALFVLKETAKRQADKFAADVIHTVQHDFYADDGLKSCDTEEQAINIAHDLQDCLVGGGFKLKKFVSNSASLVESFPEEERGSGNIELEFEPMPVSKVLGLAWNPNVDDFQVRVRVEPNERLTKRICLSTMSRLFDPLCFISPVILQARIYLRAIWQAGVEWDDPIPKELEDQWRVWEKQLPCLQTLKIPRVYFPNQLDFPEHLELHCFSDASDHGLGVVAYLRREIAPGSYETSLVNSRAKTMPLRYMTIPRAELQAAVLAVTVSKLVNRELGATLRTTYWTDATLVLMYLNRNKIQFKTFVANRRAEILDYSIKEDWRHCPGELNPADIASRGMMPSEFCQVETTDFWLHGPAFLRKDMSHWPTVFDCNVGRLPTEAEIKTDKHCKSKAKSDTQSKPIDESLDATTEIPTCKLNNTDSDLGQVGVNQSLGFRLDEDGVTTPESNRPSSTI